MTKSAPPVSPRDPTRISLSRQALPVLPFARDPRSALPRLDRTGRFPGLVLAGVPATLRATFNRNLEISSFPYPRWTRTDGRLQQRTLELVTLENRRWRVTVCSTSAVGIMSLYDKAAGAELLWQSPVLRQSWIGLAGAWTIGGIEFNAFRFGHLVHGQSRLGVDRVRTAAGGDGIAFGAMDELFGCSWSVILSLLRDRVAVRVRLENHSAKPQPGYWWTNIAVPMHNDTRVFYQPGPVLYHGFFPGFEHANWPRLGGQDWSYWPQQVHLASAYFHQHTSDVFGYADARQRLAVVHHADHRVCRGRKLWSLGAQYEAHVWWERVAEHNLTSYAEMQSGRCPTQLEADLLEPGQVIEWTESFTSFPWAAAGEYPEVFGEFERRSALALRQHAAMVQRPAAWRITARQALVRPEPRVAISDKVVRAPGALRATEIESTVCAGWVGGDAWIAVLERRAKRGAPSLAAQLALAAAHLDAGHRQRARSLLMPLRSQGGEVGTQAGRLLALLAKAAGKPVEAVRLLRAALARFPRDPDLWAACHDVLFEQRQFRAAEALWQRAPHSVRATDPARVAVAHLAFLRGEWSRTRALLAAPLWSVAEANFSPWLLRREAEVAEAFALWRWRRYDEAALRLVAAGESMPQFGIGRNEATGNTDLLYYRWRLARQAGQELLGETLAAHVSRLSLFPGTMDAAYAWRLAIETRAPAAAEQGDRLRRWTTAAHSERQSLPPVRTAVIRAVSGAGRAAWAALKNDPLWRYRARFEMEMLL